MARGRGREIGEGYSLELVQGQGDDHVFVHAVQEHSRLPDAVPAAVHQQQLSQELKLSDGDCWNLNIVCSLSTLCV